jgi:predicted MFS family arabinose efflux permease
MNIFLYFCNLKKIYYMQSFFRNYFNSFRGFSKEVWILATITFINRSGTMVLPFLSKYLKENLGFSFEEVGWIMVCFGLGSMLGSWIGGKLTDKIGFYKVMIFSLLTSGILFVFLQYITSFVGLCFAMVLIMTIADMFRPAMFVSLGTYAKPENRTRAFTLVRLSVNLGFAAGPAIGGLIIMNLGYSGLFWVDGITCIIAILIFWLLIKEKKAIKTDEELVEESNASKTIFRDKPFLLLLGSSFCVSVVFFQLFTTLPLYHHDFYKLSEFQTGLFMATNGFLIFILEMPMVSFIEKNSINKVKVILLGTFLFSISFFILMYQTLCGVLWISLIILTIGEMMSFPFFNSVALSRAPKGQHGKYMGIFSMSFSFGHIFSSKMGMEIIDKYGYVTNWLVMGCVGLLGVLLLNLMNKMLLPNTKKST